MEIYSHGVLRKISFFYTHNERQKFMEPYGIFSESSVDKIDKNIFNKDSVIISYACRTGISIEKNKFNPGEYAGQDESLAQYMANRLKITIKAYEKRTSYADTYGTEDEKLILNRLDDGYYFNEGFWGAPPYPEKVVAYSKSVHQGEENDQLTAGPIMPMGALNPPTTGKTPKGLKDGLQTYIPKK